MHRLLETMLAGFKFSGDLSKDSFELLCSCGNEAAALHSQKVSQEAVRLAGRFRLDVQAAATAGYLHDIGRIFSDEMNLQAAEEQGLEILDEERINPMLLHQKLSRAIAKEVFGVEDTAILDAIECHTTLKANASSLDLLLMVADKLSWDSKDSVPILQGIMEGLEKSLEQGAYSYLSYIWNSRENMKVVHPWIKEAYDYLKLKCE